MEQLGERTQEVSQAASEHASASEEVTAAAEEQTASTEEMAAAAGDLLQGATRLTAHDAGVQDLTRTAARNAHPAPGWALLFRWRPVTASWPWPPSSPS